MWSQGKKAKFGHLDNWLFNNFNLFISDIFHDIFEGFLGSTPWASSYLENVINNLNVQLC